ncbi:Uncharacterised protein [Ewingella americana]|jgi:uncharacterized protein YpmB|uniref:Uncharacterized protein n=1 Tax=Ewingella americana TaxID=41202 RepID=A0A377N7R6_9GAMM|nr:Uncharacterised protein [Ewingella americana]
MKIALIILGILAVIVIVAALVFRSAAKDVEDDY